MRGERIPRIVDVYLFLPLGKNEQAEKGGEGDGGLSASPPLELKETKMQLMHTI